METKTQDALWRVEAMTGFKMTHRFIVLDPACPEGRHPTRWCGCQTFRTRAEADAYAGGEGR